MGAYLWFKGLITNVFMDIDLLCDFSFPGEMYAKEFWKLLHQVLFP